MASISSDPQGNRTIQFVAGDGKRRTLRLGKAPMKVAESIKAKIEEMNSAAIAGHSITNEVAEWLGKIGDDLHEKVAAIGLVPRRNRMTLGGFLDDWLKKREGAKPNSLKNYKQAIGKLVDFFGYDTTIHDVTPSKAENWMVHLVNGHAKATAGRILKFARQFFKTAMRDKLIAENPFVAISAPAQANEARKFFITKEVARHVLDTCPDAEWRLIFALARFGGIRIPSELMTLRWVDVNWEKDRILVHAPKTEHHDGGGMRFVPIFPELRPFLEEVFELANPGAEFVITKYRDPNCNLRTQLLRIIRRAGVQPWPKLFVNLRSSRETELAGEYPIHVVCKWIGNTERIAAKHYLQVTEDHFARAAKSGTDALQNPVQQEAAPSCKKTQDIQEITEKQGFCEVARVDTSACNDWNYTRQESNL
jgi:integrase